MLAQADLAAIPAALLKDLVLAGVASAIVLAFVASALFAGLQYFQDRRRAVREDARDRSGPAAGPRPVPGATLRDLGEKHAEHGRRLDLHDRQIDSLWTTLRVENTTIRKEMTDKFDAISRALGRIEGRLNGDHAEK